MSAKYESHFHVSVLQIRQLASGEKKETLSVGLACSECFSGPHLAQILKRGFEYEQKVMEDLMSGSYASPLSIHTSSGVPEALSEFIDALEPHLPWKDTESLDWCVSLQLEGASAVWAGIDMLLQEQMLRTGNKHRKVVAVGGVSYHGPPSTSFGAKSPMWHKNYQITYPVPIAGKPIDEAKLLSEYEAFLNKHGEEIGVLLVEPQWGSSQAAFPWPESLLKQYVKMAQERGIRVLADEIMCGLGRHGQGTLFSSTALELDPDAITFGKAIAGGVFPLSGAIMKRGRDTLCQNGRSVMQSHTFAGSSARSLMTGAEVLNELPNWFESISNLGQEMCHIFSYLSRLSDGMLITHGQGLMWGGLFTYEGKNQDEDFRQESIAAFKRHCDDVGVLPYFVPAGGFMCTPVVDVDVGTIYEIGEKLEEALKRTMSERGWKSSVMGLKNDNVVAAVKELKVGNVKCRPQLHATRSCTICASFVCQDVRSRFLLFK